MAELGLPGWCADYPYAADGLYEEIFWYPKKAFTRGQVKAACAAEIGGLFTDIRVRTVWMMQAHGPDWSAVECDKSIEGAVEFWRCTHSTRWDRQQRARVLLERAERRN
jgi:hypothetical protein